MPSNYVRKLYTRPNILKSLLRRYILTLCHYWALGLFNLSFGCIPFLDIGLCTLPMTLFVPFLFSLALTVGFKLPYNSRMFSKCHRCRYSSLWYKSLRDPYILQHLKMFITRDLMWKFPSGSKLDVLLLLSDIYLMNDIMMKTYRPVIPRLLTSCVDDNLQSSWKHCETGPFINWQQNTRDPVTNMSCQYSTSTWNSRLVSLGLGSDEPFEIKLNKTCKNLYP